MRHEILEFCLLVGVSGFTSISFVFRWRSIERDACCGVWRRAAAARKTTDVSRKPGLIRERPKLAADAPTADDRAPTTDSDDGREKKTRDESELL